MQILKRKRFIDVFFQTEKAGRGYTCFLRKKKACISPLKKVKKQVLMKKHSAGFAGSALFVDLTQSRCGRRLQNRGFQTDGIGGEGLIRIDPAKLIETAQKIRRRNRAGRGKICGGI